MVDDPGGVGLAERVIDHLPEDRELTFFDESGYNPRDFGVEVVVRAYDGEYYYQLVGYGSSRRWKRESRENLIAYLARSLHENDALTLRPCVPGKPRFFGWLAPPRGREINPA